MAQYPRFGAVAEGSYYYVAYTIVTRRGVIRSDLFWRKRDAIAERATPGKYSDTDRVARVKVVVAR